MSTTRNDEQDGQVAGRHPGRRWAERMLAADPGPLDRLEERFREWDDAFFADDHLSAFTAAERLVFVLWPEDDGDRGVAREFWESIGTGDPHPSAEYVEGFVEGGLEVWEARG